MIFNDVNIKVNILKCIIFDILTCVENYPFRWYYLVMLKKVFVIFLLLLSPVYAGVFEDAMKGNDNILLYIYGENCSMCKTFAPVIDNFSQTHKNLMYVKVSADTQYGMNLMRKFNGRYVPFVVIISPKSKKSAVITPYCSINEMCLERAVKSFKG